MRPPGVSQVASCTSTSSTSTHYSGFPQPLLALRDNSTAAAAFRKLLDAFHELWWVPANGFAKLCVLVHVRPCVLCSYVDTYVSMYVCMFVCMYVGMCVCGYTCMYLACTYVCMCLCMYVCTSVCIYVCLYICMYDFMYACMCVYVCMYVCKYVCMHV